MVTAAPLMIRETKKRVWTIYTLSKILQIIVVVFVLSRSNMHSPAHWADIFLYFGNMFTGGTLRIEYVPFLHSS